MKFLPIAEEHLPIILKWRTSEQVTSYMYTDIKKDMKKQKEWFLRIKQDSSSKHWIMEYKGEYIGYVSLTNIDQHNKRAHWNYYIGEENYNMLGAFIGHYVYNYVFNELYYEKLIGEVMEHNEAVIKIHNMHGARQVGVLEKHILKFNNWYDVYLFEMTKEKWMSHKSYNKYKAEVIV